MGREDITAGQGSFQCSVITFQRAGKPPLRREPLGVSILPIKFDVAN